MLTVCPTNCLQCQWVIDKTECDIGQCKAGYTQDTIATTRPCIGEYIFRGSLHCRIGMSGAIVFSSGEQGQARMMLDV